MMLDDVEGLNDSPRGPPVYGAAFNNALLHNNGYGNNNIVIVAPAPAPAGHVIGRYGGNYNYNNANNVGQNGQNIHDGQRGANGGQLGNGEYGIMVVPIYTPDKKERRFTVIKTNEFDNYRCCCVCNISSAMIAISSYRICMAAYYGILAMDLYVNPNSMADILKKPIYYGCWPLYAISGLAVGIYGIQFKNITLSTPEEKYMHKSRIFHRLTLGMMALIVVEMIAEWIVDSYPDLLLVMDTFLSVYFFYVLKKYFKFKSYQRHLQQQQLQQQQQLAQQQGR